MYVHIYSFLYIFIGNVWLPKIARLPADPQLHMYIVAINSNYAATCQNISDQQQTIRENMLIGKINICDNVLFFFLFIFGNAWRPPACVLKLTNIAIQLLSICINNKASYVWVTVKTLNQSNRHISRKWNK